MAARKRLSHPDKVRERIRTSQLVVRLTKHVLGKIPMEPTQVTAALGLLKKTLPDLSAVEHSGEIKQRDISDQPLSADDWEKQYAGDLAPTAGSTESTH